MTDLDQHHYQMVFRNSQGARRRNCRNTAEGAIATINAMTERGWAAQVWTIPRYECANCAGVMDPRVVHRDWLGWPTPEERLGTVTPWTEMQAPQQPAEYRCSRCQVLWITRPGEYTLVQDGQPVCPNCAKRKSETRVGNTHAEERGVYNKQAPVHYHGCSCGAVWGSCYRADCGGSAVGRDCPWHEHTYTETPDFGRDMILAAFGE